jgi:two-component system response regulator YesN
VVAETCFIVDDEPIEVMTLEIVLKERFPDMNIYMATGGTRLFELLDLFKPDLLIIDIQMPGLNGLDIIKEVKEMYPKVQVAIISAHEYFEYAQRAIDLGVKRYLVKPASREEVIETVHVMLQEVKKEKKSRNDKIINKEKNHVADHFIKKELILGIAKQTLNSSDIHTLMNLLGVEGNHGLIVTLKYNSNEMSRRLIHLKDKWTLRSTLVIDEVVDGIHIFFLFCKGFQVGLVDSIQEDLIQFKAKYSEDIEWGMSPAVQEGESLFTAYQEALSHLEGSNLLKDRVEKFIKANGYRDLRLEEAAAYANFSVHYFSRWFKKHFHMNFTEYIQELRMNKAVELLNEKRLSVKEVSYQTGFNDPNYFSKLFKKVTGKKPTDLS